MSFLKQIDDKGAVLAWSPVPHMPNVVAIGTKVSAVPPSIRFGQSFIFIL
jgi:hypothetical protein